MSALSRQLATVAPRAPNGAYGGWKYCLYGMKPMPGGRAWKAFNRLRHLSFGLPRSFVWHDLNDPKGLQRYVDLMAAGRRTEAAFMESTGTVTDVEYDPEELQGYIQVDAESFFSTLALVGWVRLPLVQRVRFTMGKRAITAAEYLTILAKYSGRPDWFDPEGARWATDQEIDALNPHSAYYTEDRVGTFDAPGGQAQDDDAVPPAETEVSREGFLRHFAILTKATPAQGQPYFIKRLAAFDGSLIWAGSSFSPTGPWTEYHRDNAQLLARGITV